MYTQEPIFLDPVLQERIWGGNKLAEVFGYNLISEHTGEAWVISAHPNGPSKIKNGVLAGKTLLDAWQYNRELFGEHGNEDYPLLVKLLDAKADLSVQVHPDDTYARKVENQPYGKTECWYIVDAEPGAEIVFGHHAQTKEQLEQMIDQGEWEQLLRRIPVEKGDFVYVPSGAIHAIGAGIVILETQQSSDITYRVYDYDRKDDQGNTRDLHLDSAKAVSTVPHETTDTRNPAVMIGDRKEQKLVQNEYFSVYHWQITGESEVKTPDSFVQVSIIDGTGEIILDGQSFQLHKGDHFVLPVHIDRYVMKGSMEAIVSHV
ncbi:mannose-6-phosphate isomerase, type 1 [Terribacillus aidingensis]|uniref:Mannose-6-phosphate isomerase n=1 Tax=Terribacillus aidingensis TaxID=586416 RepID=A0A285MYT0_9BACI|nr:mannose-6-phosphate isomerase, class I [Terribacillus aidingensis]SNZ02342.1 mannose-6-phosphate isomerase, type 1 [Terribacillus aidingensis]